MITVVIDAGHGGQDSGAVGAVSKEKDHALDIARRVAAQLCLMNVNVYMTRSADVFKTLLERSRLSNSMATDVFVSIHLNAATNKSAKGTETHYWQSHSLELAQLVNAPLVNATGFINRGVKKSNFSVIRETHAPCVLCEIGFITNLTEEQAMLKSDFRQKVAEGITDGIVVYLMRHGKNASYTNKYTLTGSDGHVMDTLKLVDGANYVVARKFGSWFNLPVEFKDSRVYLGGNRIEDTRVFEGVGYIPIREAAEIAGLLIEVVDKKVILKRER